MSIKDQVSGNNGALGSDICTDKVDHVESNSRPPHQALQRQLKNRHIAMISIGGVIGTGLFLNSANALRHGGPVGLLLGYVVIGSICYSVMISLGEMISYLPVPGGHIKLAERFVDPAFSFWTFALPAELSAAAVLIDFWDKNTNLNSAWVTICLVVVIAINFMGAYGEAEFLFASIKVLTITGLIILGIVLDLGGGPDHDRIGFRFWKHPGPFVQFDGIAGAKGRFLGWWAVLIQAAFSFIGTEIVAIAAGEAKNPRRNLPKAIRRVYIRILLFYIGGVTIIGLLVSSNDSGLALGNGTAAASPFVIAIKRSGIKALPQVWGPKRLPNFLHSAASSDLYTSSRALYGLAIAGNAPSICKKTLRNGLPVVALAVSTSFTLLAYMGVHSGSGKVFNWFSNMTSVSGLLTWFGISYTYTRFYAGVKAQGIDRKKLPFSSPLQPFAAWYGTISCLVICLFNGWSVFLRGKWNTADFITSYLPLALFPLLYIAAKVQTRVPAVKVSKMDFYTGLAEIEASTYDEPPPRNKVEVFWRWLVSDY
ncbi:amino acid permease [Multifurca ochricompacta]|uniref:Amino acid permease n=1 Tax=Multifurca ochricompacta TaxID=376703 RepID=A0AAD4MCI2_9AGAM|nr:amino acid permease [Multifurca ochricompacta]